MRSWSAFALVLLLAASFSAGAAPASAHSALVSSDPAADVTVTVPLDRVTLTFSEAPLAGLDAGLRIEVRDGSGRDVSSGSVGVAGTAMSKAVTLADGTYRVVWRYVSPDGHPITGEYGFTASGIAGATPSAAPTVTPAPSTSATAGPTATATATAGPASATTHAGHSPVAVWVIGAVALLAAAAAVVAAVLRRRPAPPAARDDDTPAGGAAA